jgi:predicted dehydrogenase
LEIHGPDGTVAIDPVPSPSLRAQVEAGATLLVIEPDLDGASWDDVLGARRGEVVPAGEYFGRVAADAGDVALRIDAEFPIVTGPFRPLQVSSATTRVLVGVSIGFRDHAVLTETRCGAGRVLVSAVAPDTVPQLSTIVRRALLAAPSTRALGLAIVGYGPFGGMGYAHGLAITATPGLELVAVVDPSDERRKAAEGDFPGLTSYASVDELVGDDDVDLAIVATPPSAHAGLTRRLLLAGKHVACEKPLCLTASQADELIATAASVDRVLTVHQNRRWDSDYLAVRRAVAAGLLGDVFNVETFVGGFEHPCRAWHSEVDVSGGAVYDWGSHHVDWILQLLDAGPPAKVTTFGHKRVWHDVTNLDQLRLHLAWDDGREAEFFQSDVAAVRRPKFYVQGTQGTLVGHYREVQLERMEAGRGYVSETAHHAEAPAALVVARYESGYGLTETRLPPAPEQRFAFHRNLADHLLLGEPLAVTASSVRDVVAVLEASQRSSDEGGRVIHL